MNQGKYSDRESPSQNGKWSMGWLAWPEYSSAGVWDKVTQYLLFILEKKGRGRDPQLCILFSSRISLQVFNLSCMSQNFLYSTTVVKSMNNQKAAVKVTGDRRLP